MREVKRNTMTDKIMKNWNDRIKHIWVGWGIIEVLEIFWKVLWEFRNHKEENIFTLFMFRQNSFGVPPRRVKQMIGKAAEETVQKVVLQSVVLEQTTDQVEV